MTAAVSKSVNETIILDSSNDTSIIECSIDDESNKNKFFKTPRSHLKRKCSGTLKNEVISLKGFQFKNTNQQGKSPGNDRLTDSLKCKSRSSFNINDSVTSQGSIIATSTPDRNRNGESILHPAVNRVLSSIKKTPDLPYLSKSRLNRIEKWLAENDVETVKTPPFSRLSGTPLSLRSKTLSSGSRISSPLNRKIPSPRPESSDSSSVDSEVKKVLVAVYGDDWRKEKVIKKSKTEPKRTKRTVPSFKTEAKAKTKTKSEAGDRAVRAVRRNIMRNLGQGSTNDDKSDDLDCSQSLGVEKLNESGTSDNLELGKNFSTRRRRRKKSGFSSDSWEPQSLRKKKVEKAGKCSSQVKKTPKIDTRDSKNADSPAKTPIKSFLASLSVSTPKRRCHPEAQDFKVNFKTRKEELAKKLFKLYNAEVFDNGLPDDMNFSWNVKLRGTAGYCYNKKIIKSTGQVIRLSRIEFSTKIIDRADRLRDTLIHELCHSASWVIDGVLDGHGTFWTKWSRKAMDRFPELPPIKRCHNYEIVSKYTYRCTGCGYSVNRHSKSINIERKRCGYCFGVLELFVNKKKRGKTEVPEFDSTRTLPTPNNFALFVKENYYNVKNSRKDLKHAEIMKILGQQYALAKDAGRTPVVK